jgi:OmpA family
LASFVQNQPDFELEIEAFTDERGTEIFNQKLAERRANSTIDFLAAKNIKSRKTTIKSLGESQQKSAEDVEQTRRINRRVDILATVFQFDDLASLLNRLDLGQKDVVFNFTEKEEKHFTTPRGTEILIPNDVFEFENGQIPTGNIRFSVREAYDPSDWFLNRLATETTDHQFLQTAGMLFTEASADGRLLRLRAGKEITIAVPSVGTPDPKMELFFGENHVEKGKSEVRWVGAKKKAFRLSLRQKSENRFKLPSEVAVLLKNMNFEVPPMLPIPDFEKPLIYPTFPKIPQKPIFRGQKPDRKTYVFRPKNAREKLYSKSKRTIILDEKFKKDEANFLKSNETYATKFAKFEKDSADFVQKITAHKKIVAQWEIDVAARIQEWVKFNDAETRTAKIVGLNKMLKNPEKIWLNEYWKGGLSTVLARKAKDFEPPKTKFKTCSYKNHKRDFDALENNVSVEVLNIQTTEELTEGFVDAINQAFALGNDSLNLKKTELLTDLMEKNDAFQKAQDIMNTKMPEIMVTSGNENMMRAYVFESAKLGWVNCDAFGNYPPSEMLAVRVEEAENAMMTIVLTEKNAAVNLLPMTEGQYLTNFNLPKNTKARLVSLKVKNGQAELAVHNFTIGRDKTPILKYEKMPIAELRAALNRLNVNG